MTTPAFDLAHPFYREAIASLAAGTTDVLGAMLNAGELNLGVAESHVESLADYAAGVATGAVAYPFSLQGGLTLEGILLLRGPALTALVGALLGEAEPPAALDELHVPMLRDTLGNVLGRWGASLSDLRGLPRLEVGLESALSPLQPMAVLTSGPLSHMPQVLVEAHPLQFAGLDGSLHLILPPEAVTLLVTSHPHYSPPETPVMDTSPPVPGPQPGSQMDPISVSRPQFQQLPERDVSGHESRRIDLLMDVPLTITVELGRQDLTIKEILELSPGALIELNRLAGEPLDLMINGQLFAKGEVVVIDESFGMRINSIVSPEERLQSIR